MNPRVQAVLAALRQEKPGPTPKARKYQHPYAHYAALYGKSERTIKRWAAEGKPLDNPDLMGEFLSPAGRKPDEPVTAAAWEEPQMRPPQPADADPEPSDSPIALDERFFEGEGILAAIERLNKAERERAAAYFQAVTSRHHSQQIQNRLKEWQGIMEIQRKLSAAAPEIRKATGLSLDRAEVQAAIGQVFASFRTAALNFSGRAAEKLEGTTTREERRAILDREIRRLLSALSDITFDQVDEAADAERPTRDPADDDDTADPGPDA